MREVQEQTDVRKLDDAQDGEATVVAVRLPPELVETLDELVAAGACKSRGTALRYCLEYFVGRRDDPP